VAGNKLITASATLYWLIIFVCNRANNISSKFIVLCNSLKRWRMLEIRAVPCRRVCPECQPSQAQFLLAKTFPVSEICTHNNSIDFCHFFPLTSVTEVQFEARSTIGLVVRQSADGKALAGLRNVNHDNNPHPKQPTKYTFYRLLKE